MTAVRALEVFTADDYFGPKKGANTLYFYNQNTGVEQHLPNNGCHGAVNNISPMRYTHHYSSLWVRYEKDYDAAVDYWGYLLDEDESPFRQCLKGVKIVHDSLNRPVAFCISDPNASPRAIVPLMMQCRVPQEQASKLRSYWWWRTNGFSRMHSLYLSEYIRMQTNGVLLANNDADYNHAFDLGQGIISLSKMKNGPEEYEKSLAKISTTNHYSYTPVGEVWTSDHQLTTKKKRFTNPVSMLKGNLPYSGSFAAYFTKMVGSVDLPTGTGLVSKNEAVTILKARMSEWDQGVI